MVRRGHGYGTQAREIRSAGAWVRYAGTLKSYSKGSNIWDKAQMDGTNGVRSTHQYDTRGTRVRNGGPSVGRGAPNQGTHQKSVGSI